MPDMRPIRYVPSEVDTPVRSALRRRKAAVIPPFTFVGDLEVGLSGYWSPTSTIVLEVMSVTAGTAGTIDAAFLVMRKEPQIFSDINDTYINGVTMAADGKRVTASLFDTVVTPHDKIYIAVLTAGGAVPGHTNVVVQMTGVVVV